MALPKKSSYLMGGTFNATPPVMIDGDTGHFQLDSSGNLKVTFTGGAGNVAAGLTGSAVPSSADYQGVNIGGILTGVTGLALGATTKAPTVAIVDGSGNQITSFGGGTQYADSAASGAAPTGTLSMGWDSVNSKIRALKVDANQNLEIVVNAALPAGTNVIGHVITDTGSVTNQAIGVAGFEKITDGTNTAAVKAASTAPVVADPALVVSISPNTAFVYTDGTSTLTPVGVMTMAYNAVAARVQRLQLDSSNNLFVNVNTGTISLFDGGSVVGPVNPLHVMLTGASSIGPTFVAGSTGDTVTLPANFLGIAGVTNDSSPQLWPLPLSSQGSSVLVSLSPNNPSVYTDAFANQLEIRNRKLEQKQEDAFFNMLAELRSIRRGIGKLIGEHLTPDYGNEIGSLT